MLLPPLPDPRPARRCCCQVLASYGHVRDLPPKQGSVDPEANFAVRWEVGPRAFRTLKDIADAARQSERLVLATDPDREGEAISWHVAEVRWAAALMACFSEIRALLGPIKRAIIMFPFSPFTPTIICENSRLDLACMT